MLDTPNPPPPVGDGKRGVLAVVGGLIVLPSFYGVFWNLWEMLIGNNDDYLGMVIDSEQLRQATGTSSSLPFAVMKGSTKNGEIRFVLRN